MQLALKKENKMKNLFALAVLSLASSVIAGEGVKSQTPNEIKVIKEVLSYDFDALPLGTPPRHIREASSWAGGSAKLNVVESDTGEGHVVQAEIENFGQIAIGWPGLQTGKTYRVSAVVNSRGTHGLEVIVRKWGPPFTRAGRYATQVFESPRKIEFYVRPKENMGGQVAIVFLLRGHTTLQIDDVVVEEVENVPPPSDDVEVTLLPDPEWPKGNLLANSGFEVGFDGWFSRAQGRLEQNDEAYEGRNVFRMSSGAITTSYLDLPLRRPTLFKCRVKAVEKPAQITMHVGDYVRFLNGTDGTNKRFKVKPEDGWKTISFEWTPKLKEGQVFPSKKFYLGIGSTQEVLVDGVEIRHLGEGMPEAEIPYAPRADLEFALDMDAPGHVATVG